MSEYGTDLQGSLLTVAHDICEHERVFGGGITRSLQWKMGDIALNPAFVDAPHRGSNFTVMSTVMQIDGGDMELVVHNTKVRDIEDGDWYAEDFLMTFREWLESHNRSQHEICLQALTKKLNPTDRLVKLRSAVSGKEIIM